MSDNRLFCDCGEALDYIVDMVVVSVKFPITKKGQISKRPIRGTDGKGSKGTPLNHGAFICSNQNCGNQYESNWSLKTGKVVRGELI